MILDFVRRHPVEFRISVVFGLFNIVLPLVLVFWFFNRAIDIRHPVLFFSQPRDEVNPWLVFSSFMVLLVAISVAQIKYFQIGKQEISTYYIPCAVAMAIVTINLLIPCWFIGWAMQDFADRGLGVFSDAPNPLNPARPFFRMLFAFVVTGMIFFTEIAAVRAYLSRI